MFKFQPKKQFLVFPVLLRIVFVPLYLMCNCYVAERKIPVFIENDWAYWGIGVSMAYTSGYLRYLLNNIFNNLGKHRTLLRLDISILNWAGTTHRNNEKKLRFFF